MKKQITTVVVIVLIVVGLCGCTSIENNQNNHIDSNNETNRFVGVWKSNNMITIFYTDGTCNVGALRGIYRIEGNLLIVDIYYEPISIIYEYTFKNDDTMLSLKEVGAHSPITYTKQ